ncbi:hypothetical protein [Paenibacillus sp. CMAA1364]
MSRAHLDRFCAGRCAIEAAVCQAHIIVKGKVVRSERGEIAFTNYGISGPPILQLSRKDSYNLGRGASVTLSVDLMSNRTEEEVVEFLDMQWAWSSGYVAAMALADRRRADTT